MIDINKTSTAASERFESDKRQFGGLLIIMSAMAVLHPLANIASGIGPDGTTPTSGVPLWTIIAGLCDVLFGTIGMLTGYLALVHDYHNLKLTTVFLILAQLAWVPYITDMSGIGKGTVSAPEENPFINPAYNPTQTDVRFVGAMGILGIFSWGFAFLGAVGFFGFSLFAYQKGKPEARSADYYAGRLRTYSAAWTIAGLAQLMLGIYIIESFGTGPLENGAIGVAIFVINFPEITIFVGLVHLLIGVWGLSRQYTHRGERDCSYQVGAYTSWILTIVLQVLVQVSYSPGGTLAADL